jgi:hypothetical protein
MFIQVITGKVSDRDAVQRLGARWNEELRPGADGFLGATIGITADGRLVNAARFESRAAAEANSQRPEQGEWWTELEKCFAEPPRFRESEDVLVYEHGDLDSAGFVQVMEGRLLDVDRARSFARETEAMLATERPELLGDMQVIYPDGTCTDFAYFTSEAAAREGESKQPSAEAKAAMQQMDEIWQIDQYLDIREPWLF